MSAGTDRQIAKALGVSDKTVGAQRAELESTAEIPQLARTTGADGKERPRQRSEAAKGQPREGDRFAPKNEQVVVPIVQPPAAKEPKARNAAAQQAGVNNKNSEAWQAEQARIAEEANRKRSEAAKAQHEVSNPRAGESKPESLVVVPIVRPPKEPERDKAKHAKAKQAGVNAGAIAKAAAPIWRLTEQFTQEQTAQAMKWSREAVRNYKALQKIAPKAWAIVGTTFHETVTDDDDDMVPGSGTTVPKSTFSERLLRNILDLWPDHQVDLCELSSIQEPKWRVRTLLMKLDSDRRHETDYFANKFVGKVEAIFAGLPKPKDWRGFFTNEIPLLFTANDRPGALRPPPKKFCRKT